jgi:ADP-heptose:LPS heptosyltransferase
LNKILVIQTASIGDVILATPVIEKLHDQYPGATIDFLLKKGNESLFTGHPFLHQVLIWDKKNNKYRDFLRILRTIRKNRYEAVITLQRFASTGLLTALSGAGIRTGFRKNPFSRLFTNKVEHIIGEGVHEVKRNLLLISDIPGGDDYLPGLYPSESDFAGVADLKAGSYYTISPASLWFTKQYPVDKWVDLVKSVPDKGKVYLLGSPSDVSVCDEIIRKSGSTGVISLAGKLSFLGSAALMKDAVMNFTNDSAPMHLASGVNAPVTAIFCSTVPEFGFGPLSEDRSIVQIQGKLYCRPCGLHGYRQCPEKHFQCALSIRNSDLTSRL